MRKIFLAITSVFLASAAKAAEDMTPSWYMGTAASLPFIDKYNVTVPQIPSYKATVSTDKGVRLGATIGYHWTEYVRTEVEAFAENNKTKRSTINGISVDTTSTYTVAYMGNILFDLPNSSRFTPYFGGGGGMIHLRPPLVWLSNNKKLEDWVPAYQLMTGVSYLAFGEPGMAKSGDIYFGYRYINTVNDGKDRQSSVEAKFPYKSQSADLGFRYNF